MQTLFLCGLSSVGYVIATYFAGIMIIKHSDKGCSKYTDDIEEIFNALDYEAIDVMLENAAK